MLIIRLFFVLSVCVFGLNGCVATGAWLQQMHEDAQEGASKVNKQVYEAKQRAEKEAQERQHNYNQAWDGIIKDYRLKNAQKKWAVEAEKLETRAAKYRAEGKKAEVMYSKDGKPLCVVVSDPESERAHQRMLEREKARKNQNEAAKEAAQ